MDGQFSQWLVGGLVVVVYAFSRFDSPTPARATTTFARYWVAKFCYIFAMLLLFTFLGGGLTDTPKFLALIAPDVSNSEKLPGPLFSALLLTTLLPHVPILAKIDDLVREQFRRLGNIPFEVVQLSARLQQMAYRAPAPFKQAIIDELDEISQIAREDTPAWKCWTQITRAYVMLLKLPVEARYASYLLQKKAWFDQLAAQYQELKTSLLDDPDLLKDKEDGAPRAVQQMRTHFREQLNALRSGFYDLLAGGILQCELGRSARNTRLKELGFEQADEVRNPLSFHEIVAVAGIVFVAMNAFVLLSPTFAALGTLSSSVMIAAMVSIIYAVALVVAIYPKGLWRFFDIGALGRRPIGAYLVSAILAAVLALFISLTFKFVFTYPGDFVGALKDTRYRWPWLVMTAGITFAIAWAADDYYRKGKDAPRWLRFAEAIGMAFVFLALQWWTQQLLVEVAQDAKREAEAGRALWRLISSGTVGFCIGFLVPHMYRNARLQTRPDIDPVATAGVVQPIVDAVARADKSEPGQGERLAATPH
jgi:hypothetical protein